MRLWIFNVFLLIHLFHSVACRLPEFKNECDPFAYSEEEKFRSDVILGNSSADISVLKFLLPEYVIACNGGSSFPNLLSFGLDPEINGIRNKVEAEIQGTEIRITMPYGRAKFAIPSFSTSRSQVFWNGNELISGSSYFDLSVSSELVVKSSNGQSKIYTLNAYLTDPVEDSGQNECFLEGFNTPAVAVACAQPTYPRQDGDFVDFPNAKGYESSITNSEYPNDHINLNKISGLVWKTCAEGPTGSTCLGGFNTYSYANAKTTCDSYNNVNGGKGYAGIKGWRLPSLQEVFALQNFGTANIFMDASKFPNSPTNRIRTIDINPLSSMTLTSYGSIVQESVASNVEVRCVAGTEKPKKDLSDAGDGTILDKRTSLSWTKCSLGQSGTNCEIGSATNYNVPQGLTQCNTLTLAGKSWRLPNISEANTLFDFTQTSAPFISQAHFPNTGNQSFRLSTNLMNNDAYAYELDFSALALSTSNNKSTGAAGYQVRCVAGP